MGAAASKVQVNPTTRTKVLTARFMVSPYIAGPLGAETLSAMNYISTVKSVYFGLENCRKK